MDESRSDSRRGGQRKSALRVDSSSVARGERERKRKERDKVEGGPWTYVPFWRLARRRAIFRSRPRRRGRTREESGGENAKVTRVTTSGGEYPRESRLRVSKMATVARLRAPVRAGGRKTPLTYKRRLARAGGRRYRTRRDLGILTCADRHVDDEVLPVGG